jgi:four helix bundle protein
MLDYEKLDVYRIALKFVVTTVEIRDRLPRGNGELQDQFKRASFSIVLNIAEGAGKLKQAGKRETVTGSVYGTCTSKVVASTV